MGATLSPPAAQQRDEVPDIARDEDAIVCHGECQHLFVLEAVEPGFAPDSAYVVAVSLERRAHDA